MTTATRKRKSPVQDLVVGGRIVADWSHHDLLQATRTAQTWRPSLKPVLPRAQRIKPRHLNAVLDETPWRPRYRLERDDDLRTRFLTGS